MANKQPTGLKAYNAKRRKQKAMEKETQLLVDLELLEGMELEDQKRLDTYVIKLSQRYPNDVKVANAMIKWVSDKRKTAPETNLLDADI